MDQVSVINAPAARINELRQGYVSMEGNLKIKAAAYAEGLLEYLGLEWLTMAHDAKGPAGDAMREERDLLYTALRAVGHTNPSVKWKQIKDHARAILGEREKAEAIARGETPAEESKGEAKHTRSTQLTLIEDLTRLYKHCKRNAKELTDAQRKAHLHIGAALADMGIDISAL